MKVLKNYAPVLTQGFGVNGHLGNDIVGKGTSYNVLDTIVSCFKGKIIEVRNNCKGFEGGGSYGNYVLIDHNNGFKTRYAHLESVKVWVGQVVEENQELGFMGNTGTSYGGHLHFEIIKNGSVIDPYDYVFNGKTFETVTKAVTRNESIDQLKVNVTDLRVRKGTGTNQPIIGLAQKDGIYNYYETKQIGDLTWYRIAKGQWLASKDYWCTIYPYIAPIEPPKEEEKPIEENNDNSPVEPPKEEVIEEDTDKPIEPVKPIKTSILDILLNFFKSIIDIILKKEGK